MDLETKFELHEEIGRRKAINQFIVSQKNKGLSIDQIIATIKDNFDIELTRDIVNQAIKQQKD